MATIHLPPDFKELLKYFDAAGVEYLLIGGYAVGYYGYPRATADMVLWIVLSADNAERVAKAFNDFGFPALRPDLFLVPGQGIRIGVPPLRVKVLTDIAGVTFPDCFARRHRAVIDDVEVNLIHLEDLLANKRAAGRFKDLEDVQQLTVQKPPS